MLYLFLLYVFLQSFIHLTLNIISYMDDAINDNQELLIPKKSFSYNFSDKTRIFR